MKTSRQCVLFQCGLSIDLDTKETFPELLLELCWTDIYSALLLSMQVVAFGFLGIAIKVHCHKFFFKRFTAYRGIWGQNGTRFCEFQRDTSGPTKLFS